MNQPIEKTTIMKLKPEAPSTQKREHCFLAILALIAITSNVSAQPASAVISGRAVEDSTGNGPSADDIPIAGRELHLFRDTGDGVFNAASDTLVKGDTTKRDGDYSFRNLPAGTYFVRQSLPAFWVQTAPKMAEPDNTITPAQCGQSPSEKNDTIATAIATGLSSAAPGTYIACGQIGDGGQKELDVDLFRVQVNAGDLLHIDVDAEAFGSTLDPQVRIFDANGRPVACDDDDIRGGFDSHLEYYARTSGTYYVGVGCSVNIIYNPFVAGSGGFATSTGDYTVEISVGPPPPAISGAIILAAGEQRSGVDMASSRLGAITGQLYVDTNGNGQQDSGEPGMDGQPVFLQSHGTFFFGADVTRSIDSNGDGNIDPATESGWYSFDSLVPDTYLTKDLWFFGFGLGGWVQVAPSMSRAGQACVSHVSSGPASDPGVPGLVPDLTVDPEHGLCDWFVIGSQLHFSQATPNIGQGPMELRAGADLGNGTQQVNQRIYQDASLTTYVDVPAGTFAYHPEHGHIHFDDYTRYSLRQVLPDSDADGVPEVGTVVAGGQKTSFCLVDSAIYDATLPGAPTAASGFGCGEAQRISVGWEDIYDALTVGQQIDITGLAAGQYWLEAVVDPDNHLRELNENNNVGRTLVTLGLGPASDPVGSHGVSLTSGQTAADRDFAIFQTISISGLVFNDANGDGRQNNKEHGLDSWIVFLDMNNDGVLNNPEGDGLPTALAKEPWAITDNQGNFQIAGQGPGTYPPRIVPKAGWMQTTVNPTPIPARSGQNVSGVIFGLLGTK
jgi:hypothetical protein